MSTQGQPGGLHWPSVAESAALLRVAALADRLGVLHDHVNATTVGVRHRRSNRRGTLRAVLPHLTGAQDSLLVFLRAVGHIWRGEPPSESATVPRGGVTADTDPVRTTIQAPQSPSAIGSALRSIYQQLDPHRPSAGLEPLWEHLKRGPFEQAGAPLVEGGAPTFVPSPLPLASNALSIALSHLHEGALIAERAAPRGVTALRRARHSPFPARATPAGLRGFEIVTDELIYGYRAARRG